ncbi:beta-1,3-galactosyltransferase 5-like [Uloborus diversus]|uniref:beta-1,3-galactosyltransferase 5-like n=1 Tax=Uloborus diversus TaxID=327109 RepID=UPI00240A1986|nr:beta-1,3-galactosyltransferase 5-like [Uloborus diversus]
MSRVHRFTVLVCFNIFIIFFLFNHSKITCFFSKYGTEVENLKNSSIPNVQVLSNESFDTTIFADVEFPIISQYVLNPTDLCSRGIKNEVKLSLLILVISAVPNIIQRVTIRETWGSIASASNNTGPIRLGFLLGSTTSEELQQRVRAEATHFGDIIQQDFMDTYRNLTLKSIMLLKWAKEFCPNVQYVLKTDDDMYINVPNLIDFLIKTPTKSNIMYGYLFRKAKPNRNPSHKWFVPKSQFAADMFPDYLSGTGYVMSRDVVPKLLESVYVVQFFLMEDIFITGFCAGESRISRHHVKSFSYWRRPATGCAFKDAISGHHVTTHDMIKIWKELNKRNLVCHKKKKNS